MPFLCDFCLRGYKYKRNLTRHVSEKHSSHEHWNCTVEECHAKFIRRSYLSKHLTICHGYDLVTARESALSASRGDVQKHSYYEDVSDDDTILDLLAEADGTLNNQSFNEAMASFNLKQFSPKHGADEKSDYITDGEIDNSMETDSATGGELTCVSDDDADISFNSDVHDGLSGENSDDDDATGVYDTNKAHGNDDDLTGVYDLNKAHGNDDDATGVYDTNKAHGNDDDLTGVYDMNKAHGNDDDATGVYDMNKAHGNDDDATGVYDTNKAHGNDDDTFDGHDDYNNDYETVSEHETIIISSDDDDDDINPLAVELSQIKTKTQTFMYSITRTIKTLNGKVVSMNTIYQRDYFEDSK